MKTGYGACRNQTFDGVAYGATFDCCADPNASCTTFANNPYAIYSGCFLGSGASCEIGYNQCANDPYGQCFTGTCP
jgi:hypothetical protein